MPDFIPQIRLYQDWLRDRRGLTFRSFGELWRWSVTDLEAFWRSIWDYHDLRSPTPYARALGREAMPGAVWFEGARFNYAAQVLRHVEAAHAAGQPCIVSEDELGTMRELSWPTLRRNVAAFAASLQALGVEPGDRVVAYMPNIAETVIAFLGCASIGAVWSVCAPDMGAPAIRDRFRQVSPKVLVTVDGVFYGGRASDRTALVDELRAQLPSLEATILLETPYAARALSHTLTFAEAVNRPLEGDPQEPLSLPFDHPLWILYSSGTTGLPKALVHSHGGVVLTALASVKHTDVGPSYHPNSLGERYHWYSTTGWVMWNAQVAGLLAGTTICLFDGSPSGAKDVPDWGVLWRFASRYGVTFFGAGAAFHVGCRKAGLDLATCGDLSSVRALGSTGSPLPAEVQTWGTEQFRRLGRPEIWWCNISGGTDLCGNFATAHRELPQQPGKMQCRQLGAAVEAWDEHGRRLTGAMGELVCTRPIPAMPIYLWGDEDGERYRTAYFEPYPGVWRHGDWIRIDEDESCTITGRSDATINRAGLRMGTSEIYSAIEPIDAVRDSLLVEVDTGGAETQLILFVVTAPDATLDASLRSQIVAAIRSSLSPRFLPDRIISAPAVPRTLSGKKQELPVKRILQGQDPAKVADPSAMANPECLDWYVTLGRAAAVERPEPGSTGLVEERA